MGWNKTPTEHKKFPKHLSLFWYLPQNSPHLPLIYIGFTLYLPWFQQQVKHTGFRTAEAHTTSHSKTIPLAGKPEMSATSNTHHGNFSILQGQRNFKIPTLASRWQLEPFRKVWDQHQALGCHGSKCLLDMESQSYTQTGTGASEFKGTMSLWGWSKLTLKILSSPRGGTESSKEQLISS